MFSTNLTTQCNAFTHKRTLLHRPTFSTSNCKMTASSAGLHSCYVSVVNMANCYSILINPTAGPQCMIIESMTLCPASVFIPSIQITPSCSLLPSFANGLCPSSQFSQISKNSPNHWAELSSVLTLTLAKTRRQILLPPPPSPHNERDFFYYFLTQGNGLRA
jgi:hypothetical protein